MIHVTDWLPTLLAAAGADETTHPGIGKVDGKNQVTKYCCYCTPLHPMGEIT